MLSSTLLYHCSHHHKCKVHGKVSSLLAKHTNLIENVTSFVSRFWIPSLLQDRKVSKKSRRETFVAR